jgi:hypothetical protein
MRALLGGRGKAGVGTFGLSGKFELADSVLCNGGAAGASVVVVVVIDVDGSGGSRTGAGIGLGKLKAAFAACPVRKRLYCEE